MFFKKRASDATPKGQEPAGGHLLSSPLLQAVGLWSLVGLPAIVVACAVLSPGWPDTLPCGDDGNIELFTWYVLHDVQLSSIRTHGNLAEHLGPLYFYLLAPTYWLLGCKYAGICLGTVLIHLTAMLAVLWTARRCGDLATMLWFGLLLALYLHFMNVRWAVATSLPWVVILPFLSVVFLMAAMATGRSWALPAAMFVGSFIVQTQLGYSVALGASGLLCFALLVGPRLAAGLGAGQAVRGRPAKAGLVCAAVLIPIWTPTAIKQAMGKPGRLSEIVGYFAAADPQHSWGQAVRTVEQALAAFPASLLGLDCKTPLFHVENLAAPGSQSPVVTLLAALQVLLLPVAYLAARRRGRRLDAAVCLIGAVLLVTCTMCVRRVPGGIVMHHIFWLTALGLLNLYVIGRAALGEVGRWCKLEARPAWRRAVIAAALVAIALAGLRNTAEVVRDMPILHGKTCDPLLWGEEDEVIHAGDESDAKRFVALARDRLQTHGVRHYNLRILGVHRCGIATGLILGLTKQGLRPALDPWHARVFTPQYAGACEKTEATLALCTRARAERLRQRGEFHVVAESRHAVLLWAPSNPATKELCDFEDQTPMPARKCDW